MSRTAQIAVGVAVCFVLLQVFFALLGIDGYWQWGHHGFNPAAYQIAAWNTLEWGTLFPAQYHTAPEPPGPESLYTNAPLLLHLHNVVAVWLFGDGRWVIRAVPALQGVLAAVALFWVVRRHYGDTRAAVALGVYVLLPINHGFANMTNHSTGFILWGLLALDAHLKGRHGWKLLFVLVCCNWDWPGYYVAFAIAVHWAGSMWRRRAWREWSWFGLFCVAVLVSFVGFFVLADAAVGSFASMQESWSLRTSGRGESLDDLWTRTLLPMFGYAVLAAGALWIALRAIGPRERDLIPLTFLFAGLLHVGLFKPTAVVHIYWPWPLNPFFAIAAADLLWSAGGVAGTRWRGFARAILVTVFAGLLAAHSVPLISELRRKGGSLHHEPYHPHYQGWLFAREVNGWTQPSDRVHLLFGFNTRPEVLATMRRHAVIERGPREAGTVADDHIVGDLRFVSDRLIKRAEKRGSVRVMYPYFYAAPAGEPGRVTYRMRVDRGDFWSWWLFSPTDPPVSITEVEAPAGGTRDSPR